LDGYADLTAQVILHSVTAAKTRMPARYGLALGATRRPDLRAACELTRNTETDQSGGACRGEDDRR